jgi:CheY-like chemotaxis protein
LNDRRPKILVADDEPDMLRLVEVILESEWSVVCAEDGDTALDAARRERPAAILLDGRMPGGGGLATLARLKDDPETRDTPVILMTALAHGSKPLIPPGFAGVIAKPFDPLTLPQQIRAILASSGQTPRGDENFERLVAHYAESVSAKLEALDHAIAAAQAGDMLALAQARDIAHRMHGTAGCYGYRELSAAAGVLDEILTALQCGGGGTWLSAVQSAEVVRAVGESIIRPR